MIEEQTKQRLVGIIVLISFACLLLPNILQGKHQLSAREPKSPPAISVIRTQPAHMTKKVMAKVLKKTHIQRSQKHVILTANNVKREGSRSSHEMPRYTRNEKVTTVSSRAKSRDLDRVQKIPHHTQNDKIVAQEKKVQPIKKEMATVWFIQLASFVNPANARQYQHYLRKKNVNTRVQMARRAKQKIYRVLLGPKKTQASAVSLQQHLFKQKRLSGIVVKQQVNQSS